MKYKAIYADVDGTLIPPGAPTGTKATKRLQNSVAEIKKRGVVFGITTARSLDWISGLVRSLSITDPVILDNGARIYEGKTKKYLVNNLLSVNILKKVLKELQPFNQEIVIVNETQKRFIFDSKKQVPLKKAVKCIVLHIEPQTAEKINQSLKMNPDIAVTKSISRVTPIGISIHITHKDASKDKALKYICDYLGIDPSQVIGIGDSFNDYDFLGICGLKVAMGNATDEIKAIADYIAPRYDQDGVADVIEKFIIRK